MSRRENESGFTNVGCRHQMWPTAHRQAKLSTIHPTLASGPRTTTLLVSYCYLSPSSRIHLSHLFLFLSHLSHRHLIIRAAPYTNALFLCIYPFRFLDTPLALAGFLSHTPYTFLLLISLEHFTPLIRSAFLCAIDCTARTFCSIASFPLSCFPCH
ncbi:hypothetical protein CY34DRAFT_493612 [Suillus luteus UH-Slu-Lm8-n1]|uniref:Uncharacterized protein n=1 Tax=Suillus luteus UH-Slu-Lm8-n1 TaxID=930992 RepID=A0A0D0AVI3_9AGAM|nr:hypothetical protein CY34DRAFT_493612 [Suillus luteus UH-Slu-Lm8-n1]